MYLFLMKRKMLISLGLLVLGERNFVVGVNFHIPLRIIYLLGQMSSFKFFLGGFLLRKNQAIRGSAIAPAASLTSLSPVATVGAPTILATRETRN